MLISLGQLIVGLLSGMFLIKWVPLTYPFSIPELLVRFILNPLEFFVASIVFILATILHGKLIKYIFIKSASIRKRSDFIYRFFIFLGVMINFHVLFKNGIWQSGVLLCFSILYGMISVVYKE